MNQSTDLRSNSGIELVREELLYNNPLTYIQTLV